MTYYNDVVRLLSSWVSWNGYSILYYYMDMDIFFNGIVDIKCIEWNAKNLLRPDMVCRPMIEVIRTLDVQILVLTQPSGDI